MREAPSSSPLVHVVGARPQFVKAAAVLAATPDGAHPTLIHTGQHHDPALSAVFFGELALPDPDFHLAVGNASPAARLGAMMTGIEGVLRRSHPGVVVVYGDTDSTLAGALVGARCGWRVVHVEAGLRSGDRAMPEEQNRIVTDHLGHRLLAPTTRAMGLLEAEGLVARSVFTGDVMLDLTRRLAPRAAQTAIARHLQGASGPAPTPLDALTDGGRGGYVLATVHRAANTDQAARLTAIFAGLGRIGRPVLLPLHPRTRAAMARHGVTAPPTVRCVPPVGYLDFAALLRGAEHVVTDSGGVQKEALFAARPCTTLRAETEWPETLADGWNALVDCDPDAIAKAAGRATPTATPPVAAFGDGHAARAIVREIEAARS